MYKFKFLLALLLLTAGALAALTGEVPNPPSQEVQDLIANNPELLTVLNNHFGCAEWDGNTCLRCSDRFYFNANGVCCQVKPQCRLFNQDVGICEQCYQGYSIVNGSCSVTPATENNIGCQMWDGNGNCLECSVRFYFNQQNICIPVSDLCRTWDSASGACLSCYNAFDLDNGECARNNNFGAVTDVLCKTHAEGGVCIECSDRAYFNQNGQCLPVSDNCNTWDALSGNCLTCYQGFVLNQGACELAPGVRPSDLGCRLWDWENQVCLGCSTNQVFNQNGVCVPVSDQCRTFSEQRECTSCYQGYDLASGTCIVSPSNTARPSDLGCSLWDWNNQVCLTCSPWWVRSATTDACVPVSDLCKEYNMNNGLCTVCYQGYNLVDGVCEPIDLSNVQPPEVGCRTWDWQNKVCLACSTNWVRINNVCVPVSDQCLTFDENTGDCVTCYKGYNLEQGKCIIIDLTLVVNPDKGCKYWNWDQRICLACADRWFMNADKVCVPVSDLCREADANGQCISCYKGYDLVKGVCELSPSNTAAPSSDLGCATWDWDNQVCLACSEKWVLINGACVPVSDQCASHDANGACTSCFKGYDLVNGVCELSPSNTAAPSSDLGCATWDWDNQVCLACSSHWVFNANNQCIPVDDNCASHDNFSGACTSCFVGYILSQGSCVRHNSLCRSVDQTGQCTACFPGYILLNGSCAKISDLASLYLYYAECCPEKLAELQNGNQ